MALRYSLMRNGVVLLVAGSAVDSTSGLFARLIAADGFTTASGRGFFAFAALFLLLWMRDGAVGLRSLARIGPWGAAFVFLNALGMVISILSLKFTTVANFFMIFATAPFAAAFAGRLLLKEKLDGPTLLAAFAGFAGVAVMMASGAQSGGLAGDLLAFCCVLTYSAIVIVVRHHRSMDMLPVICLTVLTSGLMALPFADFGALSLQSWAGLALFGIVQLGVGNLLIFNAVGRISAAQAGLLGILNAAFAPMWVFLFLGEVPPASALAGGAIILGSSLAHLAWSLSQSKIRRR